MTDEELMELLVDENEEAFTLLYEKYKNHVYRYIHSLIGKSHIVEDIFHEIFLSLYRSRKSYARLSTFKTYLFSIARSKCIDYMRKNKNLVVYLDNSDLEKQGYSENFAERLHREQVQTDFNSLLSLLPDKQKSALHLKDVEGMDYETISTILNMPLGTVKTLIHRGRESIYKEIRSKYE